MRERRPRLLLIGGFAILLVISVVAIGRHPWLREQVIPAIAFWLLQLEAFLRLVPPALLWVILSIPALAAFVWQLSSYFAQRPAAEPDTNNTLAAEPVAQLTRLLQRRSEAPYFRHRVDRRVSLLVLDALGYDQRLSIDELVARHSTGQIDLPASAVAFVAEATTDRSAIASMSTRWQQWRRRWRRRVRRQRRARDRSRPASAGDDDDLLALVTFLESYLEVPDVYGN